MGGNILCERCRTIVARTFPHATYLGRSTWKWKVTKSGVRIFFCSAHCRDKHLGAKRRWCSHSRDKVRMRSMPAPYSNIWIGTDPLDGMCRKTAESFDAFVNVSDTACNYFDPARQDQRMHWYPVNEMGRWGYGVFWFVKQVLDWHHERGHKIYLHCHAGACRSPTNFVWWLVSRGVPYEEALATELGSKVTPERLAELRAEPFWKYRKDHMLEEGQVPRLLPKLYERMLEHPTSAMACHLYDPQPLDDSTEIRAAGMQRRENRYQRLKWWHTARSQWRAFKSWYRLWKMGEIMLPVEGARGCYRSISRKEWKADGKPKSVPRKGGWPGASKEGGPPELRRKEAAGGDGRPAGG